MKTIGDLSMKMSEIPTRNPEDEASHRRAQLEVLAPPMVRDVPAGWIKSNWTRLARATLLEAVHKAVVDRHFVEEGGFEKLLRKASDHAGHQAESSTNESKRLKEVKTRLFASKFLSIRMGGEDRSLAWELRRNCRELEAGLLEVPSSALIGPLSEDAISKLLEAARSGVKDPAACVRRSYAKWFPEIACDRERLTDSDLRIAAEYMDRQKPATPGPRGKAKWPWLANWMLRIGIGTTQGGEPVTAEGLRDNEWKKWRAANKGNDSTPTI